MRGGPGYEARRIDDRLIDCGGMVVGRGGGGGGGSICDIHRDANLFVRK